MKYSRGGFTLMEIVVVMALVMILSVVGIGSYTQATIKSKDTRRKGELSQLVRALESFNQDVSRYPISAADNTILCYVRENGVVTNPICDGGKLYSRIDGEITNYMTIPTDPVPSMKYVYVSPSGSDFKLYTSLENTQDKDLLIKEGTTSEPDLDPWGISCGATQCNYLITEEGLTKTQ